MNDALGKFTFAWLLVAAVLWLAAEKISRLMPELNVYGMREFVWGTWAQSIAVGWAAHTFVRRSQLDNSYAEVVGLLVAVGYLLTVRGLLNI